MQPSNAKRPEMPCGHRGAFRDCRNFTTVIRPISQGLVYWCDSLPHFQFLTMASD